MDRQGQLSTDPQKSITLYELQSIAQAAKQPEKEQSLGSMGRFSCYLGANDTNSPKTCPIVTVDTNFLPSIPMRRVGCKMCLQANLRCEDCRECVKSPAKKECCRGLGCIFEYSSYTKARQRAVDLYCRCDRRIQFNSQAFEIDWRLLNLLSKYQSNGGQSSQLQLNFQGGLLYLQQRGQAPVFQDNFSLLSYNEQSPVSLFRGNSLALHGLLKKHLFSYVDSRAMWKTSNLEEQCEQVKQKFGYSNPDMQSFKDKFVKTTEFVAGKSLIKYGKETSTNLSQKDSNKVVNNPEFSQFENALVQFYYSHRHQKLFVRNAQLYPNDEQARNLRGFPIQFEQKTQESLKKAVWFKDLMGDIFCVVDKNLYVFKFDHRRQVWVQLQVRQSEELRILSIIHSSIYIQRIDSLYYLDHHNFTNSRRLSLYRGGQKQSKKKEPIKQGKSCSSAVLQRFNFRNPININSTNGFRLAYVMEDVTRRKTQTTDILPVIYILNYRQLLAPLPLAVTRFSYDSTNNDLRLEEYTSKGIIPNLGQDSQIHMNIQQGVYFILSDKSQDNAKPFALYLYIQINDQPMLVKGIFRKDTKGKLSIEWSAEKLVVTVFQENNLTEKKKDIITNGFQFKTSQERAKAVISNTRYKFKWGSEPNTANNHEGEDNTIYLNDQAGVAMNNQIRYMGYLAGQNRIIEVVFHVFQGQVKLDIYDLM